MFTRLAELDAYDHMHSPLPQLQALLASLGSATCRIALGNATAGRTPSKSIQRRFQRIRTWSTCSITWTSYSVAHRIHVYAPCAPSVWQCAVPCASSRPARRYGDLQPCETYLKAAYHLERDWPHLIASTGFAVLRPPKAIVPALLGHIVQSATFVRQVVANSGGVAYPAITADKLGTLFLVIPPLPEQRAIVRYLDYVDRRIRRYVAAKRKLIALLEEEKQAVVNQAVTRGLDPNVRLKPSGVEWLGDVPEHWEVTKLARVVHSSNAGEVIKGWWDRLGTGVPLHLCASSSAERLRKLSVG